MAALSRGPRMGMALPVVLTLLAARAAAHDHHTEEIPEGMMVTAEPLDAILWIHILLMSFAFGIVFPTGMVLGMVRSRLHVPVQVVGAAIAVVAYFLGHMHGGRQFRPNVHASFSNWLMLLMIVQMVIGLYLKLHMEKGTHGRIRRVAVFGHGIIGKAMPLVSWVQMLFGGITALGFCHADHLGQCAAHFIMGSAFIVYGVLLTILLLVGQRWLKRTGKSQEFFDSAVIAAWGCVNTFTEHRWGQNWGGNDIQHTTMGVVWWCAGLLGVWYSRKRDGSPRRNLFPALVIFMTGWAMGSHHQILELSTHVHATFGYTLMAAGLVRIIEIAFVLKDKNALDIDDAEEINSFQYLTPYLLYASGFLFMGANEEQMALLVGAHITHVSYILVLYSIAFLLFLFVSMLVHLYAHYAMPVERNKISLPETSKANGRKANGHVHGDSGRLRDVEEFELTGLMSDDEDAEGGLPSTAGRATKEGYVAHG